MELYNFIYYALAWSITVAVLGFITFPWAMVAYKIWHGNKPIDEELREELFVRSLFAGWVLAMIALVVLALDYVTITTLELPAGPLHLIFFLSLLGLASWAMMYYFSLEDFFQGLILLILYLYIPTFLLILFRNWNPLYQYVLEWLPPIPTS